MSHEVSLATLQKNLDDALWREALARLAIDALLEYIENPNPPNQLEAVDAEFAYRIARQSHNRAIP